MSPLPDMYERQFQACMIKEDAGLIIWDYMEDNSLPAWSQGSWPGTGYDLPACIRVVKSIVENFYVYLSSSNQPFRDGL